MHQLFELIDFNIFIIILSYFLGSSCYFVTFINYCRIYSFKYLLKKNKMIIYFQKYKVFEKNLISYKFQLLQTLNDIEFILKAFKWIFTNSKILHQFIAIYIPQQNNIVKEKKQSYLKVFQVHTSSNCIFFIIKLSLYLIIYEIL